MRRPQINLSNRQTDDCDDLWSKEIYSNPTNIIKGKFYTDLWLYIRFLLKNFDLVVNIKHHNSTYATIYCGNRHTRSETRAKLSMYNCYNNTLPPIKLTRKYRKVQQMFVIPR